MWILKLSAVLLITELCSSTIVENTNFVVVIYKYNSKRSDINNISIKCLGALVHPNAVLTVSSCQLEDETDYYAGVFDWSKPGDPQSKIIAISKIDKEYIWLTSYYDSSEKFMAGLTVLQLATSINNTVVNPINIPDMDTNYDNEYIHLHIAKSVNKMELQQHITRKIDPEKCHRNFNTVKYVPSIINCFKSDKQSTVYYKMAAECMGQLGSPVVYAHKNNSTSKSNYYLSGLMFETNQCRFIYSNFNSDQLDWLNHTITNISYDFISVTPLRK